MIGDVSQRLVDLPIIREPTCSKGLYDPIESKLGICSSVMDERIVEQDDNDETTLRSTSAWSWSLSTGSVTDPLEGWSDMSLVAGGRDMVVLKEGESEALINRGTTKVTSGASLTSFLLYRLTFKLGAKNT